MSRETVRHIRKREGLQVVKQQRKRRALCVSTTVLTRAEYPKHAWSYDFVHDETRDGRRLQCLPVLEEYTREGLAIYCARSITAGQVLQVLQQLFAHRGPPRQVKSENGPEFIAKGITEWLQAPRLTPPSVPQAVWGRTGLMNASTTSFALAV